MRRAVPESSDDHTLVLIRTAPQESMFLFRDPLLARGHELGRRPPLRLLLAGTATVSRIGHVLATLAALASPAGDASLGILPSGLLSPTQRALRRRLAAPAVSLSS